MVLFSLEVYNELIMKNFKILHNMEIVINIIL